MEAAGREDLMETAMEAAQKLKAAAAAAFGRGDYAAASTLYCEAFAALDSGPAPPTGEMEKSEDQAHQAKR
jgi:hypothetical protein